MTARRVLVGCLSVAAALVVCGFLWMARSEMQPGWLTRDRVAMLPLYGTIETDEGVLFELQRFREDRSVKALVVAIDSPGGAVGPAQSIYEELRKLRDEGMPVVASIGAIGASGGYYVALAADTIVALPGSVTGSIGVIMELPNATELLAKVGVSMEVVKSAEHKDMGSVFRQFSDSDRQLLQDLVSDVYEQFVGVVSLERELDADSVRRIADGRLLSGRQAVGAGLVDREGNIADAIAIAGRMSGLGGDPAVVFPPEPRRSLLDVVLGVRAPDLVSRLRVGAEQLSGPRLRFIAR